MKIVETRGKELTKRDIYKMTKDNGLIMMKDVEDNTIISVVATVEFIDEKETENVKIFGLMDKDGTCYAYQSKTFHDSLMDIMDIMADEEQDSVDIIKTSGKSKCGRNFINCKLA